MKLRILLAAAALAACNVPPAQVAQDIGVGTKIVSLILGGITDVATLLADVPGSTPPAIVAAVDSFTGQTGRAEALPSLTADQQRLLDEARRKALLVK
ncbi:MAG: hypothetical protein ACYCPT_01930 [Acidimicrobiales bacterium]